MKTKQTSSRWWRSYVIWLKPQEQLQNGLELKCFINYVLYVYVFPFVMYFGPTFPIKCWPMFSWSVCSSPRSTVLWQLRFYVRKDCNGGVCTWVCARSQSFTVDAVLNASLFFPFSCFSSPSSPSSWSQLPLLSHLWPQPKAKVGRLLLWQHGSPVGSDCWPQGARSNHDNHSVNPLH